MITETQKKTFHCKCNEYTCSWQFANDAETAVETCCGEIWSGDVVADKSLDEFEFCPWCGFQIEWEVR